jgi:hypothetical protein
MIAAILIPLSVATALYFPWFCGKCLSVASRGTTGRSSQKNQAPEFLPRPFGVLLSPMSALQHITDLCRTSRLVRKVPMQPTYDTGGVDLGLAVASCASTAVTSRSPILRVAACARVELPAT